MGVSVPPATGEKLRPYVTATGEVNAALRDVVEASEAGQTVSADTVHNAMYALESFRESGSADAAARAEIAILLDDLQECVDG